MRNFQLKQQILFAIKQELQIQGQELQNACYYYENLNLGIKFYDFVFIEGKPLSFEIENDLKMLKPKKDLTELPFGDKGYISKELSERLLIESSQTRRQKRTDCLSASEIITILY